MIIQTYIKVKSGAGGNGAISGLREKFVPRGGPDGGDGGDGGSVYIYSDPNVNTLINFMYKREFVAGHGSHGRGNLKHGKNGKDIEIAVPIGTEVWRDNGKGWLVADLALPGQRGLVAEGGKGGRGNASFASSTNRFPLLAEEGEEGELCKLRLELKLVAEVGIIGAPNVGKSSLLSAVSAARPKVASYPFTTLEPVLGVVERKSESFVAVEIPGLIKGAHKGVGLGHDFLRHVERTNLLVHVVDGMADDPVEEYLEINQELRLFNEELAMRPQIVAINKVDIPDVRRRVSGMRSEFLKREVRVQFISAVAREGLDSLLDSILQGLHEVRSSDKRRVEATGGQLPVLRPKPSREPVRVRTEEGMLVVAAPAAERIAAVIDATDWNARVQFYGYLKRIGVVKALEEAGVEPGTTVRIGKVEWEWE